MQFCIQRKRARTATAAHIFSACSSEQRNTNMRPGCVPVTGSAVIAHAGVVGTWPVPPPRQRLA
jgi:hypothetical protein